MKLLMLLTILLTTTSYGQIVSIANKIDAETKEGFHGKIEHSIQLAAGNTNYNMNNTTTDIRYGFGKHIGIFLGNKNFKRNKGSIFTDSELYHLRYRYYFIKDLAFEIYSQQNRNIFRALERRRLFGGGIRKEIGDASIGVSILQESEDYTSGLGGTVDNRFNFFLAYTFWPDDNIRADIISYYQPRIRETSNVYVLFDPKDRRALIEASLSFKIGTRLYYKINHNVNYDQKPPSKDIRPMDVLVTQSVAYEF